MAEKQPTSNAEPMVFETIRVPNLHNERGRLAREAADLTKAELQERAAALGVDTAGAGTKAELTERVQDSRG